MFMKSNLPRNNPKIHITESASDTVFDNCEFVGIDVQNEGKRTKILRTKFKDISILVTSDWHAKWWGKSIMVILTGLVLATITHLLGLTK